MIREARRTLDPKTAVRSGAHHDVSGWFPAQSALCVRHAAATEIGVVQ
jgi:hypothetical protein